MLDVNSFLLGIAATLTGILIKHFLDKSRAIQISEQARRQDACEKFRAAIAHEIALWHSSSKERVGGTTYFTLRSSSITAPILEFRPFIKNRRGDYDKARYDYEEHKTRSLSMTFEGYEKSILLLEHLLTLAEREGH